MRLHQLEYLVAVADDGSFTRAAERLRVAQPGVSAQVRKLERELGHTLLDRSGAPVVPTPPGAEVIAAARRALDAVADVRAVADELSGLVRGRVRAGAVTSGPFLDVPEVLADFATTYPEVEVTLSGAGTGTLLDGVREGLLDVALVGLAGDDPPGLEVRSVGEETLVLAVPPGDPLVGRAEVELTEVADRAVVTLVEGTGLRVAGDAAFAAAGVRPRVAFEVGDPSLVARMVARGLGVAVLPASLSLLRSGEVPSVVLRGATAHAPRARLALVWRSDPSPGPAARALIRHLMDAVR